MSAVAEPERPSDVGAHGSQQLEDGGEVGRGNQRGASEAEPCHAEGDEPIEP